MPSDSPFSRSEAGAVRPTSWGRISLQDRAPAVIRMSSWRVATVRQHCSPDAKKVGRGKPRPTFFVSVAES